MITFWIGLIIAFSLYLSYTIGRSRGYRSALEWAGRVLDEGFPK